MKIILNNVDEDTDLVAAVLIGYAAAKMDPPSLNVCGFRSASGQDFGVKWNKSSITVWANGRSADVRN